jgi:hypothetical protein
MAPRAETGRLLPVVNSITGNTLNASLKGNEREAGASNLKPNTDAARFA